MKKRPQIEINHLQSEAKLVGMPLCGVSCVEKGGLSAPDPEYLKRWQEAGYGADMSYMHRSVAERCDATFHHDWVRSVVSFAIPYSSSPPKGKVPTGYGQVARYAWGRDYHRVLKKKLQRLGDTLKKNLSQDFNWRPISDSFPLLERAFAKKAKLGFVGKNTMLIRPKLGSFFFLAEVLTDLEIIGKPLEESTGGCGTCSRCIQELSLIHI